MTDAQIQNIFGEVKNMLYGYSFQMTNNQISDDIDALIPKFSQAVNEVSKSPWIDVKERLPEKDQFCLLSWRYDDGCEPDVETGTFSDNYWQVSLVQRVFVKHEEEGVTHWMPIPKLKDD